MTTVDVSVPVLKWAQHRSGRPDTAMSEKFKAWHQWLNEEKKPTFAQVEAIARYTHVPVGYFFLSEPPVEELPIPDFRVGRGEQAAFSDDLLETLYLNQRRQAWYEDYISELSGVQPLPFVGSAKDSSVTEAAVLITNTLGYGVAKRKGLGSATAARSYLMARFEELGGLVVINSMVKNDTHRMLSIEEAYSGAGEMRVWAAFFVPPWKIVEARSVMYFVKGMKTNKNKYRPRTAHTSIVTSENILTLTLLIKALRLQASLPT